MDTEAVLGVTYRARTLDSPVSEALKTARAVVIEGPRACGKTMTGLHAARSYVFLDDPDTARLRDVAPDSLLDGARPVLIDEWQLAPELWNQVRRAVDQSASLGQFILTGSSVPADDVTRHSGAGRFLRLRQRTLTWHERDSTHSADDGVSLSALIRGDPVPPSPETIDYSEVVSRLTRSGFPSMTGLPASRQRRMLEAYLAEIARTDIRLVGDIRHSPQVIRRLVAAIARSSASPVTYSTLASNTAAISPGIKESTVARYVELLERLFVIERQPAWTPRLRSRARLRTKDKLHLADPSLVAVALGADHDRLARDPETTGLLFESAVFHDLSALAVGHGGEIHHYRDSNGREIDAILALPDGRWGAIEVRIGGRQIPAAADSLASAVAAIDTTSVGEPMFRMIVTGTGPTLTLKDGTVAVPLHRLRP